MDSTVLLGLVTTLLLSLFVAWALIRPFFESAAELAADAAEQPPAHKEQLLTELEELEQGYRAKNVDLLTYQEQRQQLLRELAPYFSATAAPLNHSTPTRSK